MVLRSFTLRHATTLLYFGDGVLRELSKHIRGYGKAVIITGRRSAEVSGALRDVEDALKGAGVEYVVFSGVTPNPWVSQADDLALKVWRESPDVIIAIGGGSVIDASKYASVIAASGGRAVDYLHGAAVPKGHIPLVAVNLTHGTGTEIDRYGVLTVDNTGEKRGHSILYPDVSFDDPRYTLTLPLNQTVYTSLDAFYHSYESATAKLTSPYITLLAGESVKLLIRWLPEAVRDLKNLEARYWLLYSSMLAGIVIDTSSTHIVHTIEHALSGLNPKLPHGCGLAIIGPRAAYYIHRAAPIESAEILRAIDPSIKPVAEDAEKAEEVVKKFQSSVGFEESLSDYGFSEKDVPRIISLIKTSLMYLAENAPLEFTDDVIRDIIIKNL